MTDMSFKGREDEDEDNRHVAHRTEPPWLKCGLHHCLGVGTMRQTGLRACCLRDTGSWEVVTHTPGSSTTLRDDCPHLGGPEGSAVLGVQGDWKLRA